MLRLNEVIVMIMVHIHTNESSKQENATLSILLGAMILHSDMLQLIEGDAP
jgi:hypothetical protein